MDRQRGFSLIELMIVVAILGVIAAYAIPTYFGQVQESRRVDATSNLSRVLAQQELFFGNNSGTYTTAVTDLGYEAVGGATRTVTDDGHYAIQLAACGAGITQCVQATATALSSSQIKDTSCRTFTLNSFNSRQSTNSSGGGNSTDANRKCWN